VRNPGPQRERLVVVDNARVSMERGEQRADRKDARPGSKVGPRWVRTRR
jgi:hypothetical protein